MIGGIIRLLIDILEQLRAKEIMFVFVFGIRLGHGSTKVFVLEKVFESESPEMCAKLKCVIEGKMIKENMNFLD